MMKIITLWQPWATWVILGWKTIETRLHPRFIGLVGQRIGIHAGLKWDDKAIESAMPYLSDAQLILTKGLPPIARGMIIGTVNVVGHLKLNDDHSESALIDCGNTVRFGLILEDRIVFDKPIPAKGKQGIWRFEVEE